MSDPVLTGQLPAGHLLSGWRDRADAALARALPDPQSPPQTLHAAMRHAVLLGGKRMRPLLVHAAGHLFGVDDNVLDAPATDGRQASVSPLPDIPQIVTVALRTQGGLSASRLSIRETA